MSTGSLGLASTSCERGNDVGSALADSKEQQSGAVAQQPFPAVDADEIFEHQLSLMLEAVAGRLSRRLA